LAKTPPTPTPPNPNPPSTKDFENNLASLKLTEQLLANVERRTQKLLILQKAIEFKIIDPKDARNYEKFIKELANADLSNLSEMKNIGKYLGAGTKRVNDLVDYTSHLIRKSDKYSEGLLAQNKEYAEINHRIETQIKSTQKLNTEAKKTKSYVDDFRDGYKESIDEITNVVDVQKRVLSGLKNIRKSQNANLSSFDAFSGAYSDFGTNLSAQISAMGNDRPKISPVVEFDFLGGVQEKIQQDLQNIISSAGQQSVEINGIEIDSANKKAIFDSIVSVYSDITAASEQMLATTTDVLAKEVKKVFAKKLKLNISTDDALNLTKDFIEEQSRILNGMPSLLSNERKKELTEFYENIQKSGDAGLKTLLIYGTEASYVLKNANQDISKMSDQIEAIPKLDTIFIGLKRALDDVTTTLQYNVESLMPRWLSSAIDLDGKFNNLRESASKALDTAASKMANGANKMEALSGFAAEFGGSIFKALGPIGLIVISVTTLYSLFQSMSESTKQFTTELGVSRETAKGLYKQTLEITTATDNLYIKQEDVLSVLKKHSEEYGMIMDLSNKANQESIKFSTALGKQYGMAAGEMYGFTQQLQTLGADQNTSEQLTAWVAKTSELAGISFSTITKDLAESSEFIAMNFAGLPEEAVKATMKLRAMGTSMKQVQKSMEKAFDFSSFLQGMTELNIMTQGVVDLSKYFDLATSLAPMEDQAKELNAQFDKLIASGQANYFTMKQFSDVTGQSSEELLRGNKIRTRGAKLSQKELDLLIKYQDKLSEAELADAKSLAMAADKLSTNEKLDATWQSIKDTLVQALLPALELFGSLLGALAPLLKIIGVILKGFAIPLAIVADFFSLITGDTEKIKNEGWQIGKMFGEWNGFLGITANLITTLIGGLTTIWGFRKIGGMLSGMFGTKEDIAQGKGIIGSLKKMFSKDSSKGGGIWDSLKGMFKKTGTDKMTGQLTGKKSTIGSTFDKFKKLFTGKKSIFTTIFDKAKKIVGMSGESPLDSPADVLLEAAKNLNEAANALSSFSSGGGGSIAESLTTTATESLQESMQGSDKPANRPNRENRRNDRRRTIRQNRPFRPTPPPAPRGRLGKMWNATKMFGGKALDWTKSLIPKSTPTASGASTMGSKLLTKGGGVMAVLGAGMDYKQRKDEGQTTKQAAIGAGSGALGGLGGAAAGAKAGAVIGSFFGPGIGTAIGAALGGIAGGIGGWWAASKTADKLTGVGEKTGEEISKAAVNSVLKGLSDPEIQRLKDAGVSDSVIEGINSGELSIEDAIKKEFGDVKLTDEQMKVIMDPNASGVDVQNVVNSAMGLGAYSTKDISQVATPQNNAVNAKSFLGFTPQYVDVNDVKSESVSGYKPQTTIPKQFNVIPQVPQQNLEDVGIVGEQEMVTKATNNYMAAQTNGSANNSSAAIKQMSNVLEAYANRPVVVQIGGTELKSLNRSLKVYNNA
jgi:hypothetical protein